MPKKRIYQFRAELRESNPPVWRQFQVDENTTVSKLAYSVMSLFEMSGGHLFEVILPIWANQENAGNLDESSKKLYPEAIRFTVPNPAMDLMEDEDDDGIPTRDATHQVLKSLSPLEPDYDLILHYDFGDSWIVDIILEKVYTDPDVPPRSLPRVLDGQRYGILEDCGGIDALNDIAASFQTRSGPEYEEFVENYGEDLDLSAFSLEEANARLKRVPRILEGIFQMTRPVTDRDIAYLSRGRD